MAPLWASVGPVTMLGTCLRVRTTVSFRRVAPAEESPPPRTRKVQDEPTPGSWAGPCQSVQSCEMGARGLDGDPPLMGEEMGGGAAGVCEEEGGEG